MERKHLLLRYGSLIILTLQTTMTVLTMRYSRMQKTVGNSVPEMNADTIKQADVYSPSTFVLTSEIIKLWFCCILLFVQKNCSLREATRSLLVEILKKPGETAKLSVPSTLYTVQNNLIILALSNLDAATYQVTYQLKILTTAFFSVTLLRKELRISQWLALLILMFGVILVQNKSFSSTDEYKDSEEHLLTSTHDKRLLGLIAILVSSLSSGFAGVYYEKLLKESSQPSVIIRNIQLGIFSILFAAIGVVFTDFEQVQSKGFFSGYTSVVWFLVLLQASGGLLVAAVIKYADNILKGFATSISIILSCLYSFVVFGDLSLNSQFLAGTSLVLGATFLYGIQSHRMSSTVASNSSNSARKNLKNLTWSHV